MFLWGISSYKESIYGTVTKNFSEYTVLVPEYPYHNGFEDTDLDVLTVRSVVDYLTPLLEFEHFTDFNVIGFSFGGLVLLEMLTLNKSSRIDKAVIWSSPILGDDGIADVTRLLSEVYLKTPESELDKVHQNKLVKKTLLGRGMKPFSPVQSKKYLKAIKSFRISSIGSDTKCLFIYDPADLLVPVKNAQYLKEMFKSGNVDVIQVKGGGHFGTKEGRKKTIGLIKNFLSKTNI